MGLAAATAALGFAIGWWLFLIGMLFTVIATIGFVFEYYRGNFSHLSRGLRGPQAPQPRDTTARTVAGLRGVRGVAPPNYRARFDTR